MEQQPRHNFEDDLKTISSALLCMGGMVESMIGDSIAALTDRDSALAEQTIAADAEIDEYELRLDRMCMETLALHQPLAGDLRFVTTAMKIAPDLERIADHAVNVCERAVELSKEPPLRSLVDLPLMARRAQRMVHGALDAYVTRDADAAREIILRDDDIDNRMEQVFRVMLSHMMEDPRTITRALRMMFIAKYFERMADQATNICEQIVFMTEAQVIKHSPRRPA